MILAIYYEFRLLSLLMKSSNHEIKYDKVLHIIFYILISVVALGSVYTSYPTLKDPSGFYIFKINDILIYCIIGSLILIFAYLLIQSRIFYQEIKNKNSKRILIIGSFLLTFLTLDRVFCNGILFYYYSYYNYIPDLIVTLIIVIVISIPFLKYLNFFESVNVFLNLKALGYANICICIFYFDDLETTRSISPCKLVRSARFLNRTGWNQQPLSRRSIMN